MECIQQMRWTRLAESSSFCRLVYSECPSAFYRLSVLPPIPNNTIEKDGKWENRIIHSIIPTQRVPLMDELSVQIEEIGWGHLVRLAADLSSLGIRLIDKKGRTHVLEIKLDVSYPKSPPLVSADVPSIFDIRWSPNLRLKDLVRHFREHLEKFDDFWSVMDGIDKNLCVVNPVPSSHSMPYRQIRIGDDCYVMVFIDFKDPRSLPECRFIGSGPTVNLLRKTWQRNRNKWMKVKSFLENFGHLLGTELPRSLDAVKSAQQLDCGICYAQYLLMDDKLGTKSGTDYTCDNSNCNKPFHSMCLADWFRSITTTRQSFNVYFGSCPYCSEPIAVKVSNRK